MIARLAVALMTVLALMSLPQGTRNPWVAQAAAASDPTLALPATAAWNGEGTYYYLRAAPASQARVVGHVTQGTPVQILAGTQGDDVNGNPWWYRVRVGGTTGYVSSSAVRAVGYTPHTWIAVATDDGDPSVTGVTARRAPSLSAPVSAYYPLGARFTVLGRRGGDIVQTGDGVWYRIAQGALPPVYIYSPYLKFAAWGTTAPPLPTITAPSAVAIDMDSGHVLYARDATQRRAPASTVKIMTALVALQHATPSTRMTVPHGVHDVTTEVGGSSMGLSAGEVLSLHDLLYGLLLPSGNDAAYTIAWNVGEYSQFHFVTLMNAEAAKLGLHDTHFTNPTGLDEPHEYTSASDLAQLARYTLRHEPLFATITRTQVYTIGVGLTHPSFVLHNLDELLGSYPGAEGVKTGTTPQAGENLVAAATRLHHSVIVVVMDSTDRYADATALLDYAFAKTWP